MPESVAYVLCGGNALPNVAPAGVLITDYAQCALDIGPNIEAAGHTRVFFHNPGGHFYLGWCPIPTDIHNTTVYNAAQARGVQTREMHVNQWLLAEQSTCGFADRTKLKLGHMRLMQDFGITEIIYYIGGPNVLYDVERDAPACVEMFLNCGEGVSLGFDACAWDGADIEAGDKTCKFFESLRKRGIKVYVEPRLNQEQVDAGLGLYVDGTISANDFDTEFSPDLDIQPGETMRGFLAPATSVPAGVTPIRHDGMDTNWGA
jgi:hypothetical protein